VNVGGATAAESAVQDFLNTNVSITSGAASQTKC